MPNGKVKRIVPTLKYLRGEYLALAVLAVYADVEKFGTISGFAAGAEEWVLHSALRTDLWERVRIAWCRDTKTEFNKFPYSEDAVVALYRRVQLRDAADRAVWIAELTDATDLF